MLHLTYPRIPIDSATIALLVLLLIIWLLPYVESFKAGSVEVKIRDWVQRAEESLSKAELPEARHNVGVARMEVNVADTIRWELVDQDPNLALAGLRIEIEKRLRELGRKKNAFFGKRLGIRGMIAALKQHGTINPELASALNDVAAVGNLAVHGETIDLHTARRAVDVGETLISTLDTLIEELPEKDLEVE